MDSVSAQDHDRNTERNQAFPRAHMTIVCCEQLSPGEEQTQMTGSADM